MNSGIFYLCPKYIITKMKNWITPESNLTAINNLAAALEVSPLVAQLLLQQGVSNAAEARQFFHPDIADLHDPFLMKDMDIAVKRLQQAIVQEERILLYGDYDVDGTTCVAMMYAFLSPLYSNIDYYIPDRDKEGYGVSMTGIDYAAAQECRLIIAMDCGIKAAKPVAYANEKGIDFIICDHHLPEGNLPEAVAILDPKRADCPYPFKELSGCGIAFKLAQAYALYNSTPAEELTGLLDFVALSIACDIVPLVGENRILAWHGLQKLNLSPRLGLWALINKSGRTYPLNVNDLVFGLGPLINSPGRLGDAKEAVRLMLSNDRNHAIEAAAQLAERNKQRQEVDVTATAAARIRAGELVATSDPKSIVLYEPAWHKGIIGITASRIAEDFHKPTVILTESEGVAVGSARSVPGFELYKALYSCGDMFISFGGHAHAAGLEMNIDLVPEFTGKFEAMVQQNISEEALVPSLEINAVLQLDQISNKFWRSLKQFAPFGPMNMNPVFAAYGVQETGRSIKVGNNHVRMSLKQGKTTISAIAFGMADLFEEVRHRPFDIAFVLREEEWRGQTVISLQIKDMRRTD